MNNQKLIINATLTGIVPSKKQAPFVPITPEEIACDAKRVCDLGASIVRIHTRDKNGDPTPGKDVYREIILRIREICKPVAGLLGDHAGHKELFHLVGSLPEQWLWATKPGKVGKL